jgi:cobalamin biosynthesis Mg chelatase CobN
MAKFNEKLRELGITEEQVSKGLKEKIKGYNESLATYKNAKSSGVDEAELSELKSALDKMDAKLVDTIERWHRNKDAQSERMKQRQASIKSGNAPAPTPKKSAKPVQVNDDEDDMKDDDVDIQEDKQKRLEQKRLQAEEYWRKKQAYEQQQAYLAQQQQQQQQQPKKKSNAIWIVAGIVAVVTLGAVVLKDK